MSSGEKRLVPKLRFPEFSEDWGNEYLDNLTTKISDGIHTTPIYNDFGEYYFINGNNLVNGIISLDEKTKRVSEEEYKKHKRELNQNTILLSINGTIGNISVYNNEKVILGKSACYININDRKCTKNFIIYFLQIEETKNYFDSELTGSTIKNLSLKTIKNTDINIPSLPEQQKIANCLSSLDELITMQTEKLKALKEHKKGLMQELFPSEGSTVPKLRFPEFNGDWEKKHLGEVCLSISSGKDKSDSNGIYNLFGSTGIIGKTLNASFEGRFILIARVGANAGLLTIADGKFGVTDNTLVICLEKLETIDFIFYSLYIFNLNKLIFGSGQPLITGGQLKLLNINIPSLEEQTKIADCLSSLDELINLQSKKIASLKEHKKGMMQQLFPSIDEIEE